jgi:hypothetical protein
MRGSRATFAFLLLSFAGFVLLPGCRDGRGPEAGRGPAAAPPPSLPSAQRPLPFGAIRFSGDYGTRFAAATAHILTRTDLYTLDSFVAATAGRPGSLWWDWPGDQLGRWLSVGRVARGYGWTGEAWPPRVLLEAVLPYQTEAGHFGPAASAADVRLLSGNAFALRGLMDAYADTGDARFLDSARRLGRFFERIAPDWETRRDGLLHEFYGHCLDGLVALYLRAGDRWALDAAERLAAHAGRTPHTHHSLSLMRGLVDLAGATGRSEYLDRVEDYLAWCRASRSVTGGLPEAMPVSEQDEGCGLADWVVVNMMMAGATCQARYVDDAERTLVNHLFFNQFHTGGFGHLSFGQTVVGGKRWQGWDGRFGSENPGCCSLWGMWALGEAGRYAVTARDGTVFLNLYAEADVALPEQGARLVVRSDFPRMSEVRLRIECPEPRDFTLALRVPAWAEAAEVWCGGERVTKPATGRRVLISRTWAGRTDVDIDFKAGLRLEPWPPEGPLGVGVFDGPLCLGFPATAGDVEAPWAVLVDRSGRPLLDVAGRPQAIDPSMRALVPLEPVSSGWLLPDAVDPVEWRILFATKKGL